VSAAIKRREFISLLGGAAAGGRSRRADKNQGGFIASVASMPLPATRRIKSRCWMNCGGSALSRAKTSWSIGRVMAYPPSSSSSMRPSW
jgi:hypothetical protein